MKPIKSAFILSICICLFMACKKDTNKSQSSYTCTSCETTPDALVANDGISKGVYKGVVVGSTGTIVFDIMNGSNTITATLVIDGATVVLTSDITWEGGESYVAPFIGVLNGAPVTINFEVNQDGSDASITSSDIPGHPNAHFAIAKETSTALIESFEGTYTTTKPSKGTFNLLLSRKLLRFGGIAREDGSDEIDSFDGTITSDGKLMEDGDSYVATLKGDVISGSFKDDDGKTVKVSGKRTL